MSKLLIETHEVIAGSTFMPTWFSDGVTPTTIASAIRNSSESLVNSVAAVASGGGHYYALNPIPSSYGNTWFVNEWIAVINANTFVSRQFVRAVLPETD